MNKTSVGRWLLALAAAALLATPVTTLACEPPYDNCTPGFWKNNPAAWGPAGLSPAQSFNAVFGVQTTFSTTLMEMLEKKGGGADALGRHAVAALLNASYPGSSYPYGPEEITTTVGALLSEYQVSLVLSDADVSADESSIEDLKDVYEALNENR